MRDSSAQTAVPNLKILMTTDAAGGVWQYSLDLASQLTARGAEVLLATMGPRPSDAQRLKVSQLQGVTLRESDFKLEWMDTPWSDVDAAGEWLEELAARWRPDIAHLNGYAHASLRWPCPVVVVAHSCVYSWWKAVHGTEPPVDPWSEYHARVTRGLRAADAVIAPSQTMADALAIHYNLDSAGVQVIHNFSTAPGYGQRAYDQRPKRPLAIAAGRAWDSGKNLAFLNDVQQRLSWPVEILAGLPHADVLSRLQDASIYVHPSLYEPFGLAVLEAARAQCCLVLADIPSLRELWDGAAVFVDPRNPDAWISELNALAADSDRCSQLGWLASRHAERYNSDASIDAYWGVYQNLRLRESAAA